MLDMKTEHNWSHANRPFPEQPSSLGYLVSELFYAEDAIKGLNHCYFLWLQLLLSDFYR